MNSLPYETLKLKLKEKLIEANIKLSISIQTQLIDYIALIYKWNAVHNLTAIRDPLAMVERHVLDSLSLLSSLEGYTKANILDVGTGAGLPGIPLALCRPDLSFVLLDSRQKKINFVKHVILSLKLSNVSAVWSRVEDYKPAVLFDVIVSRAFASLSSFVRASRHACQPEGKLIAMKGIVKKEELDVQSSGYTVERIQPFVTPQNEPERCLVFLRIE